MKTNRRKTKTTVSVCLNFDDVAVMLDICEENNITMSALVCATVENMLDRKDIEDILARAKEIRAGRRAL